MSVDYGAVYMFGLYFKDRSELDTFVEQTLKEDDERDVYDVVYDLELEIQCLNNYSGNGFILGWNISIDSNRSELTEKWKKLFPDSKEEPEDLLEATIS